ncbi:MAG: tRNA 2-thiocytidine(32) synthetase TtcA [Burkholderiales bacterium]|nr:tRNA 2-thiocytidine(32) synthetase TtcA [Burkholderiales bacterium]
MKEVSLPKQKVYPNSHRLSFENRKLEKRLVRLCAKAITDYNMIEEGDKVMVCVSGGKDSYALLDALVRLKGRAEINFDLLAFAVDQHLPNFPRETLIRHFEKIGVPYLIEEQDTYSVIKRKFDNPRQYCSLCSRMRRGIIYRVATEQGCPKIALGHHMDDAVSTFLINMFYGGRIKSMPPKLLSDVGEHVVIRPLIYMREKELARWSRAMGHEIIPKLCGADDRVRREMKEFMAKLDRESPGRVYNIFRSLGNVVLSHLHDQNIFDFINLKPRDTSDT